MNCFISVFNQHPRCRLCRSHNCSCLCYIVDVPYVDLHQNLLLFDLSTTTHYSVDLSGTLTHSINPPGLIPIYTARNYTALIPRTLCKLNTHPLVAHDCINVYAMYDLKVPIKPVTHHDLVENVFFF